MQSRITYVRTFQARDGHFGPGMHRGRRRGGQWRGVPAAIILGDPDLPFPLIIR